MKGIITTICVGLPQTHDSPEGPWRSAIYKSPIIGPVTVNRIGLEGDGQATRFLHGGSGKALLAYAEAHYSYWQEQLNLPDMGPGGFGENLCWTYWDEESVCIGDIFEAGEVQMQVSQPRDPCWKLNRKWSRPDLMEQCRETGRTGWYLRVLKQGKLEQGQPIKLVDRPHPEWSVLRAFQVKQSIRWRLGEAAALASLSELAPLWRAGILKRLVLP